MVNFYAGDKETANQEIDDDDERGEWCMRVYNKLKIVLNKKKMGIVEHLNNIAETMLFKIGYFR